MADRKIALGMKKLVAILREELYWKVLYFIGNQYYIALIIRLIFGITLKCKFKMLVSVVRNFLETFGKLLLVCILLLPVINFILCSSLY